ncbi:RNA-dependent RNA polymerase [rice-associated noda-like virus 1]|nr:RNA-dependent RNA polymerase [rice-associated noda-like virus 1]
MKSNMKIMWSKRPKLDKLECSVITLDVVLRSYERYCYGNPKQAPSLTRFLRMLTDLTLVGLTVRRLSRFLDNGIIANVEDFVPIGHRKPTIYEKFMMVVQRRYAGLIAYVLRILGKYNICNVSMLIEKATTRNPDLRKDLLRTTSQIRAFPMVSAGIHSHPNSAMWRSAMAAHMNKIAEEAGYIPYNVSKSANDNVGTRYFYFMKDLAQKYEDPELPHNAAIIMTDVDYYADMNAWLLTEKPILIYTLYPTTAAHRNDEYSFYIDPATNSVVYNVSGGAKYQHHLWDYKGDTIGTFDRKCDLITYSIEQRKIAGDENHRFILLCPVAKVHHPYGFLVGTGAWGLQRRDLTSGYLYDDITDQLSILVSEQHSVEITGTLYESIKQRLLNKTASPLVSDIERLLRDNKVTEHALIAPLLYNHMGLELHRNVVHTTTLTTNYHPVELGALATEDGKPGGEAGHTTLVNPGACFPTVSEASDISTVIHRVLKPCNTITPPRIYNNYADEFRKILLMGKERMGAPWSYPQVIAEQNGPLQRVRIDQIRHTVMLNSPNRNSAFVKNEAYPTINAPRNITTMSGEVTLSLSSFTYPFKHEILKNHKTKFYSPGMSPIEITERLAELTTTDGVIATDYTKFDGSISQWLQLFVKNNYTAWLDQRYVGEFEHWFNQVFVQRARTKHGVQYNPHWSTRSGSPLTTDGNTQINAFVVYCALRKLKYEPKESFSKLGLYCGDDGYTRYYPGLDLMMTTVAKELGLTLDIEVNFHGPYSFCGRRFIDPSRIPDSYQDIKRTLPKLHLVRNGTMSIAQRLTNKAVGYQTTDDKTPIIGNWARKVLALTGLQPRNLSHEEAYKMNQPWPQESELEIEEHVAADLEITSQELKQLCDYIDQTTSLDDFPILFEWTPDAKITAVRSGVIEAVHINEQNNQHGGKRDQSTSRPSRQAQDGRRQRRSTSAHQQSSRTTGRPLAMATGGSRSPSISSLSSNQTSPEIQRKARGARARSKRIGHFSDPELAIRPDSSDSRSQPGRVNNDVSTTLSRGTLVLSRTPKQQIQTKVWEATARE